jgi:hypothetical protein
MLNIKRSYAPAYQLDALESLPHTRGDVYLISLR